jgi:transketolase
MKSPKELRKETFELAIQIGCPHIAPSLSTVEILLSVYGRITKNDKFILSKGHGCVAWYVILRDLGYNPKLTQHPDIDVVNGIECTTGSLGHGLPIAVGMALANKLNKSDGMVYVLMGDGECQEGTIWESSLIASQYELDNLCVIIDYNRFQTLDRLDKIVSLGNISEKLVALGYLTATVDGHNMTELNMALDRCRTGYPKAIVAHTVKGKGISYMENNYIFHARLPNEEEINIARSEL